MASPHVIVKGVEIWGIWWPTVLLNDLRTVYVQPLLRDTCRVCWSAILVENEPSWHQLLAVLDKLNFHSLHGYARIIAFAPHPCSRSVCIRILSACDTFPILTAFSKCWLLTAILHKYRVLYLHIRLPDEFTSPQRCIINATMTINSANIKFSGYKTWGCLCSNSIT